MIEGIIDTGTTFKPPRIVIYGKHGIGKTSFGASADSPVCIQTEDGLNSIPPEKFPRFPLSHSYQEVIDWVGKLYSEEHSYSTLVIDSLDWLERRIWEHVCGEHNVETIEKVMDGFGKGYTEAAKVMDELLGGLTALRDERNMAIVLTAHAQVKRFDDPMVGPYDRYRIKLHERSRDLVEEWADAVLFATQEVYTKSEDVGFNKTVTRSMSGGDRVMHTSNMPAFDAKNRYSLPPTLPLSWDALMAAMTNQEPVTQITDATETAEQEAA